MSNELPPQSVESISKYLSSLKVVASVIAGLVLLGMALNVYVSKFALGSDLADVRRETQELREQSIRVDERLDWMATTLYELARRAGATAVPPPPP